MMEPALTIIPAGAGSGKTYYLQHELARRIKDEGLAPESIVAVTFTEAAAAELQAGGQAAGRAGGRSGSSQDSLSSLSGPEANRTA